MATIKNLASLYGRSERTVKRWKAEGLPIHDPVAMTEIISRKQSRLGVNKIAPKPPVATPAPEPEPATLEDRLARLTDLELLAMAIHLRRRVVR
jgi:hypothetical protein